MAVPASIGWRRDAGNIALLLALYFLQGIPIGLSASMPMYLVAHGASNTDQGFFAMANLPYSLKFLWAPLADTLTTRAFRLGRRKAWIVPAQLVAGALMLWLSRDLNDIFGGALEGAALSPVNVPRLTLMCAAMYAAAATQDIAVDAWALTLLHFDNVGLASTCNTVGQVAGVAFGNGLMLALASAKWSHAYIRAPLGLPDTGAPVLSVTQFFAACGIGYIVFTLGLWLFKTEVDPVDDQLEASAATSLPPQASISDKTSTAAAVPLQNALSAGLRRRSPVAQGVVEAPPPTTCATSPTSSDVPSSGLAGVRQAYVDFLAILALPPVQLLAGILLTMRMGTSIVDTATSLVLQERGVSKEAIGFMDSASVPIQLILPVLIAPLTAGRTPLTTMMTAIPGKLAMGIVWVLTMHTFLPRVAHPADISSGTFMLIFSLRILHAACETVTFAAVMAFFSRVSDPLYGATYVTALNALANFGAAWTKSVGLFLMDVVQRVPCTAADGSGRRVIDSQCSTSKSKAACAAAGGVCTTEVDGYVVLIMCSAVVGVVWLLLARGTVAHLQRLPPTAWRVKQGA